MFVVQTVATVLFALSCSAAFISSAPMSTKWFFAALALIVYLLTFMVRMLSIHSVTKWACRITVFIICGIAIYLAMLNGLITFGVITLVTLLSFIISEAVRRWA